MKYAFLCLAFLSGRAAAQQVSPEAPVPGFISQATSPPVAVSNSPNSPFNSVINAVPQSEIDAYPHVVAAPATASPPGVVVMVPPPRPPAVRIVTRPQPRAPVQTYISAADYPPAAIAAHAEGRVHFLLTIGPDGRVARCHVFSGIGSQALDSATCIL